jgi:hypothetical protein
MSDTPASVELDPNPHLDAPRDLRLDRATRWLALSANLGVFPGLVLVIVEVRQNAEPRKGNVCR